jgi:hypothetical protein
MAALGAAGEHEAKIKREVSERAQEMKKLDARIKEVERGLA